MATRSKISTLKGLASAVRIATRPGGPSMGERAQAVPRLVRAVRSGQYTGTSMGRLLLMLGAAGYLVSPVDLIPEGLFGVFGLADDAMVGSWLVAQLVAETEAFLEWENANGSAEPESSASVGGGRESAFTARGQTVRGEVVE